MAHCGPSRTRPWPTPSRQAPPCGTGGIAGVAAVLANLGAGAAATAVDTPFAPKGALPLPQSVRTVVQGQRGDGSAVFAQGVWFARAAGPQMRLYHAVVYTGKPRPELADQFFAGIVLP